MNEATKEESVGSSESTAVIDDTTVIEAPAFTEDIPDEPETIVDPNKFDQLDGTAQASVVVLTLEERTVLCNVGMQIYTTGDFNSAIDKLEQGLLDGDQNWKARICLGICYYNTWQLSRAEQSFSYILEHSSDTDIRGRVQKALEKLSARLYSLQEQKVPPNSTQAESPATDSTGANEADQVVATEPAIAEDLPENVAEASSSDEDVVLEPPSTPEEKQALCKAGIKAYFADDYKTAIADLSRGLYEDRENWKAHFCLGMSYYNVEKFQSAEKVFSEILEHCTDSNIRARSNQALNTVHQALTPPEEQAAPLVRDPSQSATGLKSVGDDVRSSQKLRRVAKPKFEWEFKPVEIEGLEDFTQTSKASPLSKFALVVFIIGFIYWSGLNMLPQIYAGMFVNPYTNHNVSITAYDYLGGMKATTVNIPAAHGTKLAGCLFIKPNATKVVLFCRGTINDSEPCRDLAEMLIRSGYSVLVYDPSGSGHSSGPKSWEGLVDDGLFAYDYLQNFTEYKPKDIIVYGRSLGSATAAAIAKQRGCGGIILENPFCNLPQLARLKNPLLFIFPNGWCPEPRMDIVKMLEGHTLPLLIVESQDPIVPPADTKALFDQASPPKDMANGSDAPRAILKFLGET